MSTDVDIDDLVRRLTMTLDVLRQSTLRTADPGLRRSWGQRRREASDAVVDACAELQRLSALLQRPEEPEVKVAYVLTQASDVGGNVPTMNVPEDEEVGPYIMALADDVRIERERLGLSNPLAPVTIRVWSPSFHTMHAEHIVHPQPEDGPEVAR